MAAPADVTFDVLLGGKVTPELLKSFKSLEDLMKKQGATAKTINAVMGRAYKETFEGIEKESHSAFAHVIKEAQEARAKVVEAFEKMHKSYEKFAETVKKPLEYFGITGLVAGAAGTFFGARAGEELIKEGIKVHRARETQAATLRATLTGRGAGLEAPEWEERAEKIAREAHVGHEEAMKMMTRLAASGRYNAEQAQRMSMALIGLGGGTAEGAEASRAAFGKASMMITAGKVRPTAIAGIAGGAGLGGALLQQVARDTGIPITELSKAFGPAKVSKRTGEVTGGALAGAKGIQALNKAILELGESRGFEMIKAKMQGMNGMFYRFGEIWEDFVDKIGKGFEEFISPIADRVSTMLESINFAAVFDAMIEKAKEWGHLIAAVWDTVANAPVLKYIKSMWDDFWKSFTGGIELYGPYVQTWNDNLHHELGTHMARHMTEAGRQWVKATSERVETFIKAIVDAFSWFRDNWHPIVEGLKLMAEAFIGLKIIEAANNVIAFGKALWSLTAAVGTATTAVGTSETVGLIGALGLIPGAVAAIVGVVNFLLKTTSKDPTLNKIADLKTTRAESTESWVQKQSVLSERWSAGAISDEEYRKQLKELQDAHEKETKATEAQIKMQEAQAHANKALNASIDLLNNAAKKAAGNDLAHFTAATDAATQSLSTMAQSFMSLGAGGFGGAGGGGGFGLGAGGAGSVSGAHFTEYGPAVAGDQPGQATYDWNSYHHVGAWPGRTGPLRAGDVALGYGAQAKYHVSPGQLFQDEYGRTWRFADRSGSKDPFNVDVFKGAMGGIFRRPTHALIGESGPEAVVPLQGVGASAAGLGGVNITVNVAGDAHDPERIARAVERVVREHWRRSAVV